MIVLGEQQSGSAIHIHMFILSQTPSHPGCHMTEVLIGPSCPLVVFTIRLLKGDAILGVTVFHGVRTIPKSCSLNAINDLPVKAGDFPVVQMVKNLLQCRRLRFNPWVRKSPWRRKWQPTPVFLPGEFHGQRSLASYHGIAKSQTRLN